MRLVFFGTPEFAVPTLRALFDSRHEVLAVVAQPDRPAGRGMRVQSPPVVKAARERGVATVQPHKIGDPEFLDHIRELAPDVGVVIAYGKILPPSLLEIPRLGFFNVHASLLPKYRGAAPIQRAIEHGEIETGVTIMRVDAELDHGPMLAALSTPIGADERAPSLSRRLAVLGAQKLVEVLRDGNAVAVEQDHGAATRAPKIEKEEGRVDWNSSARSLFNKFRAFDPWPGIFTTIAGETVKLTEVTTTNAARGMAGEIVAISESGIDIATADGTLRIARMQRPGKRPVHAVEFARVFGLSAGARLE